MKKSWRVRALGDLLEVQNGYAFDSKFFNESKGMPLIRIRDLKAGLGTDTRYSGPYDERYVVRAGDLLIGMDGDFGCYEWKGEPALLNQRVCRLQGFSADLHPRFLFYGVNSHLKAIEAVTGYATVKHLSSKQVLSIAFPLPPLSEQERVVRLLDESLPKIEVAKTNARRNALNSISLFESHLQSVFTEHGAGWSTAPLAELAEFRNGINYTKASKGERIKVVGVRNFQKHFYAPLEDLDTVTLDGTLASSDALKKDDILAVRSNGNAELIGRCMLVRDVPKRTAHSGFTIRIRLKTPSILPAFLCYFLKSSETRRHFTAGGTGTNIKSLNQGLLSALEVPFPREAVQKSILESLTRLSDESQRLSETYSAKQTVLDGLRASLLGQAFAGQL